MKTTRRPGDTLTCACAGRAYVLGLQQQVHVMQKTYRDEPGTETATCAAPGCGEEFTKRPGAKHQIYCSRRCRNHMAKVATAAREAMVPKGAKPLRMKSERLGGTVQGGAMVSGTRTLWRRVEHDPRNPPQDDPRFF